MRKILKKAEFFVLIALFAASFFTDSLVAKNTLNNPLLNGIFGWITNLGSVIAVLILMTSLFLWEGKKQKQIPVLWLSFFLSGLVSYGLKFIVRRPRLVEPAFILSGSSFPSIHAAIAFATVPLLDKEFPHIKWFWFCFAVLVALSRVYFKYHYFSDVFAGALIGYFIGFAVVRRLG